MVAPTPTKRRNRMIATYFQALPVRRGSPRLEWSILSFCSSFERLSILRFAQSANNQRPRRQASRQHAAQRSHDGGKHNAFEHQFRGNSKLEDDLRETCEI